jgi:TB2/DP1, HVA22 family
VHVLPLLESNLAMAVSDFLGFLSRGAVVGLGMVYPGYKSYKAIKASDVAQQKQWLQYWLVLSVLSALMVVLEPILLTRVPFYGLLKIGAVAYLVLPKTQGYRTVYHTVLEPQLAKHEATIDAHAEKFLDAAHQHAKNIVPVVNEYKQRAFAATQNGGKKAK